MFVFALALLRFCLVLAQNDFGAQNLELVDPFIGSVDGGNVLVGASLPYGSKSPMHSLR